MGIKRDLAKPVVAVLVCCCGLAVGGEKEPGRVPVTAEGYSYAPAMARTADGTVWVAWQAFAPESESSSVRIGRLDEGGIVDRRAVVSTRQGLLDPQIAAGPEDRPWVVWAEDRDDQGWDIYGRPMGVEGAGDEVRLTEDGKSLQPAMASGPDGTLWVAWQSKREGNFRIYVKRFQDGAWTEAECLTENAVSNHAPALSVGPDGTPWVAWDTFHNAHYDISLKRYERSQDRWSSRIRMSRTAQYDMSPSLAVDDAGRVWVAWLRSPDWTGGSGAEQMTKDVVLRGYEAESEQFVEPQGEAGADGERGVAPIPRDEQGRRLSDTPRVVIGQNGAIHLLYRRFDDQGPEDRGWHAELLTYSGSEWSEARRLSVAPVRDPGFQFSRVAGASAGPEGLWTAYQGVSPAVDPGALEAEHSVIRVQRIEGAGLASPNVISTALPSEVEPEALEPSRGEREVSSTVQLPGGERQLLWGQSYQSAPAAEGLNGPSWEMYRRAREAASLDFIAMPRQTQTTNEAEAWSNWLGAEVCNEVGGLITLYGLGASLHEPDRTSYLCMDREAMRLSQPFVEGQAEALKAVPRLDAEVRERVLSMCHYRDRLLERFSEARDSGLDDHVNLVQTPGYAPEELKRYLAAGGKPGVVGVSDRMDTGEEGAASLPPFTTTAVWATDRSREGVFGALAERRSYATNGKKIRLEFRADGHFMGEEYSTHRAPTLHVRVEGTTAIEQVKVFRNNQLIRTKWGSGRTVELTHRDNEAGSGNHFYYVRVVEQRESGVQPASAHLGERCQVAGAPGGGGGGGYRGRALSSPIWVSVNEPTVKEPLILNEGLLATLDSEIGSGPGAGPRPEGRLQNGPLPGFGDSSVYEPGNDSPDPPDDPGDNPPAAVPAPATGMGVGLGLGLTGLLARRRRRKVAGRSFGG